MAAKKAPPKRAPRTRAAAKKADSAAAPDGAAKQMPDKLASPDQLRDGVASVVAAFQAAAQDPSADNVDRLAKLSAALEAEPSVREQAEALAESARISEVSLKRIRAAVPAAVPPPAPTPEGEVEAAPPGKEGLVEVEPEERGVSFDIDFGGGGSTAPPQPAQPDMALESFFQQVSGSVIRAQQRLDLASLAYSQELKDSPIPPSLFSIPKVTAEIKLGLSAEKGSNVLVTLFGKPENTTNFSESTVTFDVVASAPPPGGTGLYSAPIPSFLVIGPERDRVAAAISGIGDSIRSRTGVDLSTSPSVWLPTAIVVRGGADAVALASRADYLFVKRGDTLDQAVFTVRINLASPRDARIVNLTDPDLKLAVFDVVAKVREWEASVTLAPKA